MNVSWEAAGVVLAIATAIGTAIAYVLNQNMQRMESQILVLIQTKFDSIENKFVLDKVFEARVRALEEARHENDMAGDVASALSGLRQEIREMREKK